MNFMQRFLRRALGLESLLDGLHGRQTMNSNTTKDSTMALISYGSHTSEPCSAVLLAELPEVKKTVVRNALNNLFTKKWFDICEMDAILQVIEQTEKTPAYRQLRAIHCMHYADMDREMREILPHLVNEAMLGKRNTVETDVAMKGVL